MQRQLISYYICNLRRGGELLTSSKESEDEGVLRFSGDSLLAEQDLCLQAEQLLCSFRWEKQLLLG